MSARYVTLVCDLYDAQGNQLRSGHALITPSAALTDVPDMQVIPPASAAVDFRPGVTPAVTLLASDNTGPQPAGWTWGISPQVPGGLDPWSFYVPAGPVSFTATEAAPCVLTWATGAEAWQVQQLPDGTGVQLSGGSLPAGFQAGATYYVTGSAGETVQLAAYQGGPALGSLSAGGGELTVVQWQLSALAPVQPAVAMGGYLPLPSGTPAGGSVPVASGAGETTAWAQLTAASVGALPATGGTVGGELSPTVTTLATSGSVPVNAALGNVFNLALTGAATLVNPAGGTDGQVIRFRVTTNGHSLAFGDAYLFGTAGEPSLSSSGTDLIAFDFDAGLDGWLFMGGGGEGFA